MNNLLKINFFLIVLIYLIIPAKIFCAESDTLKVFESTAFQTGSHPEGLRDVISKNEMFLQVILLNAVSMGLICV